MGEVLDDEFKQIISRMKPHAKKLPQKSEERSKVTSWIKKLLAVKIEKAERNEYAKLLLQVLKSSKLEPPFTIDPPQGLLPRLGTFKPITRTGASTQQQQPIGSFQSTNTQREVEKTTSDSSRDKAKRRASEHKGARHHHTTQEHRRFEQIPKATPTCTSPLYLIQTNLPDSGISYGAGEGRVHTSEEGLWSLDAGPSTSLQRPNPQASRYESRSPSLRAYTQLDELLSSSPSLSLSDEILGSDDSQLSDVSELLLGRSEHWTKSPKGSEKKHSFMVSSSGSYSPKKAFTSSFPVAVSPRKYDITKEILQSREIELKVKAAENQFEEEKLKIQRSHEESLKQIFDRKNNELENLRTECRLKGSQMAAQVRRVELKLSQSLKENKALREEGSQSLADSRQYRQKLEAQFEEKLHAVVSEFETSKLELEQHYGKAHQRLVAEMTNRMASIKDDHTTQRRADAELISALKTKLKERSRGSDNLKQAHSELHHDKEKLDEKCSSLQAELKTAQDRVEAVEVELLSVRSERDQQIASLREERDQQIASLGENRDQQIASLSEERDQQMASLREEKECQLRELRTSTEESVAAMQHEYTIQESKMYESIAELKGQVSEMEREMGKAKEEQALGLSELEAECQRAVRQRDLEHDKRVIELKREASEREMRSKERLSCLEEELRGRDEQLETLRAKMEAQSKQAEQAIDDFKAEVEQQTSGMFDQMKGELSSLEKELTTCRVERASEREQFSLKRKEDRARAEGERGEMELRHRQTVEELVTSHKATMEGQREELVTNKEEMVAGLSSELTQLEAQAAAKEGHYRKVVSSLEGDVRGLREQVEIMARRHGGEILELERQKREEVAVTVRIHEAAIGKLKTQLARVREEHKREIKSLTEKHDHQHRQVEHQYSLRDSQSTKTMTSLKAQVQFLEENMKKQQSSHEDHMRELMHRNGEEMDGMKQHHDSIRQSLTEEAEAAHLTVSQHQERSKHQLAEHNSNLSQLKRSYEEKLRGMLPLAVKQEYEDTIKSLRTQISILQQRAGVLQDELNQRYSAHKLSPTKTLSPF